MHRASGFVQALMEASGTEVTTMAGRRIPKVYRPTYAYLEMMNWGLEYDTLQLRQLWGASESTVRHAKARLVNLKLISVTYRKVNGAVRAFHKRIDTGPHHESGS